MGKTGKETTYVEMLLVTMSKLTPYIAILTVATVILSYIIMSANSSVTSDLLNPSRFDVVVAGQASSNLGITAIDLSGIVLVTMASTIASYLMLDRQGAWPYESYAYDWTVLW